MATTVHREPADVVGTTSGIHFSAEPAEGFNDPVYSLSDDQGAILAHSTSAHPLVAWLASYGSILDHQEARRQRPIVRRDWASEDVTPDK